MTDTTPIPTTETLSNALLYLMTAYQRTQCPCLAAAIVRHLEYLAAAPDTSESLRMLCNRLRFDWSIPGRPGANIDAGTAVGTGARH